MNLKLKARMVEFYGSQRGFSREIGINEGRVSQVVKGHWRLSPEERQRWAERLHEDEGKLFASN